MIRSIRYSNFRSLSDFQVSLRHLNVFVGPNNSGKSTILDGLRLLSGAYRFAASRIGALTQLEDDRLVFGWPIPPGSMLIDTSNIHTDYNSDPSEITYRLNTGNALTLHFPRIGRPILFVTSEGPHPKTKASFRKAFPSPVAVVPTLGPLEKEEEISDQQYVRQAARSHRAARLFRNLWHYDSDGFEEFALLVAQTWPGATISPPERIDLMSNQLAMYMQENRLTREVAWSGSGFQVWIQLLTHVLRASDAAIVVVDEPEIYLHPDLQRQIVTLLRKLGPQVALATHSVDIINEVEPEDVVLVHSAARKGRRLTDIGGLQEATDSLGSAQNIQLMRLAREKRVMFVEGADGKILRRLCAKLGYEGLLDQGSITVIPISGFSGHTKVENAQWAFEKILGEGIRVSVLLDRDYRSSKEVDAVRQALSDCADIAHILCKKEIENYLLHPSLIERVVNDRLSVRYSKGESGDMPDVDVVSILLDLTSKQYSQVKSQIGARRIDAERGSKQDAATILLQVEEELQSVWGSLASRLALVSGKELLSAMNRILQDRWSVSITVAQLGSRIKRDEIDPELVEYFDRLAIWSGKADE